MKLIHCADLHLEAPMTAHLTIEQAKRRRQELLVAFQDMVEAGKRSGVEVVLIAGDLFDHEVVSAQALQFVMDVIAGASEMTFFYLPGNHDMGQVFPEDLLPENLKVFGTEWEQESFVLSGGKRLVISGVVMNRYDNTERLRSLSLNRDDVNLVMLHGILAAGSGAEYGIDLKELQDQPIAYLALGHIHTYQSGALRYGTWCYPGCLQGRGFDECGAHGYQMIDIDEVSGKVTHAFCVLPGRRFMETAVDVTGGSSVLQMKEDIMRTLQDNEITAEDYVRINLTGEVPADEGLDMKQLQFVLERDGLEVQLKDRTEIQIDYENYRMQPSLKGKLVEVVEDAELSDEMKNRILRLGFRVLRGEGIE